MGEHPRYLGHRELWEGSPREDLALRLEGPPQSQDLIEVEYPLREELGVLAASR